MDKRSIDGGNPNLQGGLRQEVKPTGNRKIASMPRFRLFRRKPTTPEARSATAVLDRSTLLRDLEVAVPAPERLVRWDTATRTCPDCAENVARSSGRCRHCGYVLA